MNWLSGTALGSCRFRRQGCLLALSLALLAAGGVGCSKSAMRDRYLARAQVHFEKSQYDMAEAEYMAALRAAPGNPLAVSRLGIIYCEEGKLQKAVPVLEQALRLTNDPEAQVKLGLAYLAFSNTKAAWEAAASVLAKHPQNREALLLLAGATTTNDIARTLQQLAQLPESIRDGAGGHLVLGTVSALRGDLAGAENEFKQALVQDPKCSQAYYGLANVWLLRQKHNQVKPGLKQVEPDLQQIESAFKAAADLAPLRSSIRLEYATFKYNSGARDEALKAVWDLTNRVPDYVPAWLFLAQVAAAQQDYKECDALLTSTLARDPVNYAALLLRGNLSLAKANARLREGNLALAKTEGSNAVAHFEQMASMYRGNARVDYNLALAYLMNEDAVRGLTCLNQAVAADTNFADAILLQAKLNLRKGDPAEATAALAGLVQRQPQIEEAHFLLAKAWLMRNEPDQALAVYRRMQALFPKDPQIPLLVGIVLAQYKQIDRAHQAFEAALSLCPTNYMPAFAQIVELDLAQAQPEPALARVTQQLEKTRGVADLWGLLAEVRVALAAEAAAKGLKMTIRDFNTNDAQFRFAAIAATPAAKSSFEQAESALLKAIELEPNGESPYLLLAQLYVASNQHQQALERLNGLVAKTNDGPALMLIGMIHTELKDYPRARDAYERILTVDPRSAAALNNLACLYAEQLKDLDKAYQMAEKAREISPYHPVTADTLGWVLYLRGDYSRALGFIQEAALQSPASAEFQLHLGLAHYMLGEEEPARVALQQAVNSRADFPHKEEGRRRLDVLAIDVAKADAASLPDLEARLRSMPDDPVALFRLGAVQERLGALAQADKTYQALLTRNPRDAQAIYRRAEIAGRLHDTVKALAWAKEANALAPQDPQIAHTLGRLAYQAGDYPSAFNLLSESARKLPNDPQVLFDLAWSSYSLGNVAEAESALRIVAQAGPSFAGAAEAKRGLELIAACGAATPATQTLADAKQALATDPNYVPALMVSALADERQGKFDEAARTYERILGRFPAFTPASRNLALLCYGHLRDEAKAYTLAAKAAEALPGDPELANALGILCYRRGEYGRSALWLQDSLRNRTPRPETLYYLGMAQFRLKERDESKQNLKRALELNLQTDLASEAKRVLADLK